MLKNILCVCFGFLICFSTLSAMPSAGGRFISQSSTITPKCDPQLQPMLNKIMQIDEAKNLIAEIQKEGPIYVRVIHHQLSDQFGAFWDISNRAICVSLNANISEGDVIGSILFELHNAAADAKLERLDYLATTGGIDRESYVQAVEYIEYENSKKAAAIANKGISLGIFPRDAALPTYRDFEEHYRYQKIGGHSAVIAKNFDQLAHQKG